MCESRAGITVAIYVGQRSVYTRQLHSKLGTMGIELVMHLCATGCVVCMVHMIIPGLAVRILVCVCIILCGLQKLVPLQ